MNKIKLALTIAFLACMLIMAGAVVGQQTSVHTDNDLNYKKGLELFNKEKYAAAQALFIKASKNNNSIFSEIKVNSDYYAAICAAHLFSKDADDLLFAFIQNYPESNKLRTAYFHLGIFKFRRKKFKEAIDWLEKIDVYDLNTDELAEYYFKLGYSYFEELRFEEASKMFFEIKDVETPFKGPAIYYYSHIAYLQKNYETAFGGFIKLINDDNFSSVVPYYIAQIYFLQERYDMVLEYAPPLLDSSNTKRAPEIARLIGESYYKTQKYKESISYLQQYAKTQAKLLPEDYYQLAYAYYKSGEYNSAIEYFKELSSYEDKLAQNALYLIADCYLKLDNKNFARNTYKSVAKYDFDKDLKEDAHFNYAKLTYELSYHPFNEAIDALQTYLNDYKGTARSNEAYKYLLNAFLTTKNYKEALISLEAITDKTRDLEYAYQKVAYCRAVELFHSGNYLQAIVHFEKALTFPKDKHINAQCYYWIAESNFNLKEFKASVTNYKTFLFEPGAAALAEYFSANYNLGYIYFTTKEYSEAISWFRKYTTIKPIEDQKKHNDALLRIADCYFINKDFYNAQDFYAQAIINGTSNSDYALYQKAVSLGLTGKNELKIEALSELLKNHPNSTFIDDAKFETGKTFQALGESENALKYFKMVIADHPQSSNVSKALVRQGLVYYNDKQDELALDVLRRVVGDYPNTNEAFEALPAIKNIYVNTGKVEEYDAFVKGLSFIGISSTSLDSTYYEAAESFYMKGDLKNAKKNLLTYFDKYPQGLFQLNAHYYLGECKYSEKDYEGALTDFLYVINQAGNVFTERALAKASKIQYTMGKYEAAAQNYLKLEVLAELPSNILDAIVGSMRANYKLNKVEIAEKFASKLVLTQNVSADLLPEANLVIGKAAILNNELDLALTKFQLAAANSKTEIGAEAKFNEAYVRFLQKNFPECEKTIFEFSDKFSSYDYWLAKAFILLSDNYVAINDNFQAKATLNSIIENYTGADLLAEAKQKLNIILESEKAIESVSQEKPLEVEFNDPTIHDNKLFEEE